jgi:hypothetical protein
MLAQYLTWHLRRALAPLTYTDEHPPARANPVAPATPRPNLLDLEDSAGL